MPLPLIRMAPDLRLGVSVSPPISNAPDFRASSLAAGTPSNLPASTICAALGNFPRLEPASCRRRVAARSAIWAGLSVGTGQALAHVLAERLRGLADNLGRQRAELLGLACQSPDLLVPERDVQPRHLDGIFRAGEAAGEMKSR